MKQNFGNKFEYLSSEPTPEQILMLYNDINNFKQTYKKSPEIRRNSATIFETIDKIEDIIELRKILEFLDQDVSRDVLENSEQALRLDDIRRRIEGRISMVGKLHVIESEPEKQQENKKIAQNQ